MDIAASLIAIALLIALLVFIRKRAAGESARSAPRPAYTKPADTTFHAVSLRFAGDACDAAKAMEGRRFLAGAAPRLPLPECDAAECKCRFRHHEDRRAGQDRRNVWAQGFGGIASGAYPQEQRKGRDRRREPPDESY